ncbi:MAG: HlyD family efflux transporter periplasmic adaptor subunit [Pseudomonadota bacterium]
MTILALLALFACAGGDKRPDTYTGTVEVTEVEVAPLVPGRLLTLEVERGARVEAGDLLFSLDPSIVELERNLRLGQVAQAEAAIATTQAQARAARVQVTTLERELTRMRNLEAAGAGTAQQVSTLSGQLEGARAQATAATMGTAQAEAVKSQAEAGVALVDKNLAETKGYAPVAGVVLSRNREPGEVIGAGMSVFTLGDLAHPKLRVYVPLTVVERISVGGGVEVRLDVDPSQVHHGTVDWISSEAEFTPRDILTPEERVKQVFAVDVLLQPEPGIHPGIPADAVFTEVGA